MHPQRRAQQQAPVLLHTHATELALPSGMTGMEERHFARALASLRPPFLANVIALNGGRCHGSAQHASKTRDASTKAAARAHRCH